jgi:hypothetical protein
MPFLNFSASFFCVHCLKRAMCLVLLLLTGTYLVHAVAPRGSQAIASLACAAGLPTGLPSPLGPEMAIAAPCVASDGGVFDLKDRFVSEP